MLGVGRGWDGGGGGFLIGCTKGEELLLRSASEEEGLAATDTS